MNIFKEIKEYLTALQAAEQYGITAFLAEMGAPEAPGRRQTAK